ncbi:MAG: SLAP domain-containing protein [Psychrobacillus sp.]
MQQLKFEASWDKAIAKRDRLYIEKVFEETKKSLSNNIVFTPIKEAINHKNELLVTVLVHNFTEQSLSFQKTRICYLIEEDTIAKNDFTIPAFVVPSKTSMPWTFIFPVHSLVEERPSSSGSIRVE